MLEPRLQECIEILPVELLDENRLWVNQLKQTATEYGLEFGWHYLLDLTWMMHLLGPVQGKRIMDAGAGVGVIQWQLAKQGAEVLSVDRRQPRRPASALSPQGASRRTSPRGSSIAGGGSDG